MHNPLAPGPSAVVGVSRVVMAASSDGRNVATVVQQAAYHMAPVVQIAQAPRVLSPTTAPITRLKVTIGGNNIIDMKRTSERRIMSVLFDNREIVEYLHANNIKVNRVSATTLLGKTHTHSKLYTYFRNGAANSG